MIVYTDGSWDNLKRGGYGWVIFAGGDRHYGGASMFPAESSSHMEFVACTSAMEYIIKNLIHKRQGNAAVSHENVVMVTDVVEFPKILPMIQEIRDRGWLNEKGAPLLNREYWERLHETNEFLQPHWEWVSNKNNPAGKIAHRLANYYRMKCDIAPALLDNRARKVLMRLEKQTENLIDKF